jgi:hypothetical protein
MAMRAREREASLDLLLKLGGHRGGDARGSGMPSESADESLESRTLRKFWIVAIVSCAFGLTTCPRRCRFVSALGWRAAARAVRVVWE